MNMKQLGNSGLVVAPLVFGGNVLGWTVNQEEGFKILDAFVDAGFNMIDTADIYCRWVPGNAGGESETIIGKWLSKSGKRDKFLIATKVGMDMGEGRKGLTRSHIMASVEASLKRLQTDYIDLYFSHADDQSTPFEETLKAYDDLIKAGKVRVIGASNYSAPRLMEALKISQTHNLPSYQALQPHYNLCERALFEDELEKVCLDNNLGVVSYYSLASGFLTGKYRHATDLSKSQRGGGVEKYLNEKGLKLLSVLDDLASKHKSTPAQIALAWLMARPSVTAPIASATSLKQLTDIMKSASLKLDGNDLKQLNII
jgi:aryl-alcohol dehydrogenase-like predicted oxidoreductase